jgi:hypothetical protein
MIDAGVTLVITGGGGPIVRRTGADAPPPGGGFVTTTLAWPGNARSAGVSVMVNCVELWKEVARSLPSNEATAFCTKPVPLIATSVVPLPGAIHCGEREVIVGTGFSTSTLVPGPLEDWPPGLATVMVKAPLLAANEAGTDAVSFVGLT